MATITLTEELKKKWGPVLDAEGVAPIKDMTVRNTVTRLLEATVNEAGATGGVPSTTTTVTGGGALDADAGNFDPVLISLVRRTQPTLVAHELMGVQPMSGPTGLIFAMKTNSTNGQDIYKSTNQGSGVPDTTLAAKKTTAEAEALGVDKEAIYTDDQTTVGATNIPVTQVSPWNEMSFSIEKTAVEAKTRALKANYTMELAQDLKAIHGLDAESELAQLLSGEITAEINREIISTIDGQAIASLQNAGGTATYRFGTWNVTTSGTFDLQDDADGRWEVEKYRVLVGVINRVAQEIALGTRRGLGNVIITSPVIASALDTVSALDYSQVGIKPVDMIGVTFAGTFLGRYKVFVDPYMTGDDVIVGYKGSSTYDAGYFYCPYVPLTMMKATHEDSFQPVIGFKTRYGMVNNPLTYTADGVGTNPYYRKFSVDKIGAQGVV